MRETSFIEQNKEKWSEFEGLLKSNKDDPDRLSELYVQITDDLSYSRTYYPNRSVRVYLNGLAQQLFYKIYKNKKSRWKAFKRFWQLDLPEIMHQHRIEMRVSLFVFFLSMGIGVLSCFMDDTFPIHVLGQSYMDMTEENIASGDPMAVYKQAGEVDMFLGITINNLRVAFITFIFGLFFAIGTIAIMIKNGVMVGTFQYYFYEQGLFAESFLTIWVHGTLEISAIIIAGGAGIVMGKGLVFPGTYSRLHSFRVTARRGLKILLGIMPIIILAGFIEGFFTRYTEAPDVLRLAFILMCLFFVLGYFVYYPWALARRGMFKDKDEVKLPAENIKEIDYRRIKRNGELFFDSFTFFKRHYARILSFAAVSSLIFASASLAEFILGDKERTIIDVAAETISMFESDFMQYYGSIPMELLSVGLMSCFGVWVCFFLDRESSGIGWREPYQMKEFWQFFYRNIAKAVVIVGLMSLFFMLPLWLILLAGAVGAPILMLWLFISAKEKKPFFSSLGRTFGLVGNMWTKVLGLSFIVLFIGGMMNIAARSPLVYIYDYFISENLFSDVQSVDRFSIFVQSFIGYFALSLAFALKLAAFSFLYFSLREIKGAESLFQRIPRIGNRNHVFGIEKEQRYVEA